MTPVALTDEIIPQAGKRRSIWGRFVRRPLGLISLIAFGIVILVGILAPWLATHDPNFVDFSIVKAPPSAENYLGGDSNGRDVYSRLLHGTTTTLYGALVACGVGVFLGVPFGVAAGYFGGKLDRVCTWISDALQSIPGMLALLIVAAGTGSNFTLLMTTLGVFISPGYFRISRSRTVNIRGEAYVDAARVAGLTDLRILGTHIVKGVYAPILIQTGLTGGMAMGMQAGLQFLGVGSSSQPSWGAMMNDGFRNMLNDPLLLLWPSAALGISIASLAIMGSTLADLVSVRTPTSVKKKKKGEAGTKIKSSQDSGAAVHDENTAALRIEGLRVSYDTPEGLKEVLHGVTLDAAPGEVLGIVGESGSGKSQTVFSILDLLPAGAMPSMEGLWINGELLTYAGRARRRSYLGKHIGYVPQEPMTNLDPCYSIGSHLTEPLRRVHRLNKTDAHERAVAALERVGIDDPERVMNSYPHQVSGGMAQRVLIAGAVMSKPALLLADEPTTALDVTVQAEVLELLRELQAEDGMALVIVTHNFGVVADICDRVIVMKDGHVVEMGEVEEIFKNPKDPYTAELIEATLDDTEDRTTLDQQWAGEGKVAHA